MKRFQYLIWGLLLAAAAVQAQAINEFYQAEGDGLKCNVSRATEPAYLPCLRIGKLHVGQRRVIVEELLGEPHKQMRVAGVDYYAYAIEPFYEVSDYLPYWVISYRDHKVYSLQATGLAIPPNIAFSSIHFGDGKEHVMAILGEAPRRYQRRGHDIEVWEYPPYPVSIEFKQGLVFSIRVSHK